MKDANVDPPPRNSCVTGSLIAIVSILFLFGIFFYKSVLLGKPLAKLGTLPLIDSLYNPTLKQAIIDIGRDPSGYLIFFPNGHFEDSMWWRLVPPLWNPLVACGYPLFGDPQSFLYSPAHLLRLFSTPDLYNVGLLLEIAMGGIGMVLLSLFCRLSVLASIFAALAFVLSPRILVQVDIGNNECLFPWLFLGFFWLADRPSFTRAALVGVLCALVAFAAHPETSFLAILIAAAFAFFSMALRGTLVPAWRSTFASTLPSTLPGTLPQTWPKSVLARFVLDSGKALLLLLTTALVSLCIASPLVFPFLEFMHNAYIYKDAGGTAVPLVWNDLVNGLLADHGPEPFFIGSVAMLLAPLGLFARKQLSVPLLCAFIFGALICLPQGFILQFLSQKPMSYIATMYGIPDLLLILALLAGLGLDLLVKRFTWPRALTIALSAVVVCYFPIYFLEETNNHEKLNLIWHTFNNLLNATTVMGAVASAVATIAFARNKFAPLGAPASSRLEGNDVENNIAAEPGRESSEDGAAKTGARKNKDSAAFAPLISLAFLALNFSSLAMLDRTVLPNNPKFSLKPLAPIAFLQEHPARTSAVGTNLFLPNTNLDFGIEDFRCFSPLLPLRYKQYLQEAGGRCYNLYFYVLPERCSKLLDMASIKYVLTRSAVRGEETLEDARPSAAASDTQYVNLGEPKCKRLIPGLRILSSTLRYDRLNSQVDADMILRVHTSCNYRYAVQYCVFDGDGKEVWSSRELVISPAEGGQHTSKAFQSWPIPRAAKLPVSIGLKLKDTWISQMVPPAPDVPHVADAFLLSIVNDTSTRVTLAPPPPRHYSLLQEFPHEGCRIYENKERLPAAYLVDKAECFHSGDSQGVLRALQDPAFDPRSAVIVEDDVSTDRNSKVKLASQGLSSEKNVAVGAAAALSVKRPDCNTVLIEGTAGGDSWLVLTDAYYPGWKCYVDGNETTIYPANFLFRAIKVSKGHHMAKFVFSPSTFYGPLFLSIAALLAIGTLAYLRRKELFATEGSIISCHE